MRAPLLLATLAPLACGHRSDDPVDSVAEVVEPVPWTHERGVLADDIGSSRDLSPRRTIIHLHSPWSHDACDDNPMPDGVPDPDCLADLRAGLCDAAIDGAFLTDHESYAGDQDFLSLLYCPDGVCAAGDDLIEEDGEARGVRITCPLGNTVTWMAGFEAEMMPVGLHHHAGSTVEDWRSVYGERTAEAITALKDAGATVLLAHTEGEDLDELLRLQDAGLQGTEIFNLHAAFDPNKRQDDLGLDPYQWLSGIAPFADDHDDIEPDLFMLAVLQAQVPSLAAWDTMLARGKMIGTAGTDAHQNVLPSPMSDGERYDSYRRMVSWFSNVLLVDGDTSPDSLSAALAAGRNYIVFEIVGTPADFDFALESQGTFYELGSDAPAGTLHVGCPRLSDGSPKNAEKPEISVRVLKDGALWRSDCGDYDTDGPGVYRVEVDIVPLHLRDFLGDEPEVWLHSYPWIYSNPIRVSG